MGSPLILNVDDDEAGRYARTRLLQHAGFSTVDAPTGEAALQVVAEQRPALVLLDVHLPDMDGFEICRTIKREFPDTLVVQVSASFTRDEDRERGLAGGADSFLFAPVDAGVLVATLHSLLRLRETVAMLAAEKATIEAALYREQQAAEVLQLRDRALAAISQGVLITDTRHTDQPIIYANPAFERLTGYSSEEVMGRNCRFMQGSETDREAVARIRAALDANQGSTETLINYRKDGSKFRNELIIAPIADTNGAVTHFIGIQSDVTHRTDVEEQLRQSQKMEAVGQLTGGIAHDFNNLLTVVIGNVEMLAEDIKDPGQKALAQMALQAAEKGASLTQHLLAFGRRQTLKPERLNLTQVVKELEPLLRRTLGEHIDLVTDFALDVPAAIADRTLLESALLNLVVNARDAMPQGGILTLKAGERLAKAGEGQMAAGQPAAFVTVSDTGTGMPPDVLSRAFEPFFTTKGVGRGTGLGLSMVYGFAEQSGGHARVESAVGRGTSVTIVLPAVSAPSVQASPADQNQPIRGREAVLVVEDDAQVRQFVCSLLKNLGYDVTAVEAAPEALALLEQGTRFDLLFTDVVLPRGMSGVELAKCARELKPDLKVVLTSGYPEDVFEQHGRPEKGTLILRKPYRRKEIADTLRKALE